MPGLVSLIDESHSRTVVEIRRRLNAELGIRPPIHNHYPHFSYQVAKRYDDEKLPRVLRQLSKEQEPLTVQANGVGVFTDSEPFTVYVPIVRDAKLSQFHENVWERTKSIGSGFESYYRPANWTPHVTIAAVEKERLGDVVDLMSEYSLRWEMEIDSIATIEGGSPNRSVEHETPLGGPSRLR